MKFTEVQRMISYHQQRWALYEELVGVVLRVEMDELEVPVDGFINLVGYDVAVEIRESMEKLMLVEEAAIRGYESMELTHGEEDSTDDAE